MKNQQLIIYLFFICFWGISANAQQIGFTTENDAYLLKLNDAYYSNGIFLHMNYADESKKKIKRVHRFELGQQIFTPLKRTTRTPADIDRPYAGYTYIQYTRSWFNNEKSVLQVNGTLGIIGPASGGEALQNTYHRWLQYAPFLGWRYQISNQLVLNTGALYAHNILATNKFKWMGWGATQLGTAFINASLGSKMLYGLFNSNQSSQLWNAAVEKKGMPNKEFYIYWNPKITLQGYNATISGGSKTAADSAVTLNPKNLVFQNTIGLAYSEGRWAAQIELVHQSRETTIQLNRHRYLGLQLQYRIN
ncbi:MAG: lipid A-modifier LpxR family protein [Sediminibacterium sp.]